jgi:hypothetical protein
VLGEDLVRDLIDYKKHRDKGVVMAARSLLEVYRMIDPSKLKRKERGKGTDMQAKPAAYGEQKVATEIPGIELLAEDSTESETESESEDEDDMEGAEAPEGGSEDEAAAAEWPAKKHARFLEALAKHGDAGGDLNAAWVAIGRDIGASIAAVKAHASEYFNHLTNSGASEAGAADEGDESEDGGSGTDSDAGDGEEGEMSGGDDADADAAAADDDDDAEVEEKHAYAVNADDGASKRGTKRKQPTPDEDDEEVEEEHAHAVNADDGASKRGTKRKQPTPNEDDEEVEEEHAHAVNADDGASKRGTKRKQPTPDEDDEDEDDHGSSRQARKQSAAKAVVKSGGGGRDIILTQEDFETIKRRQFNREVASGLGYLGEKGVVRVDNDDIEGYKRKVKMDRDAKIAAAMEGREVNPAPLPIPTLAVCSLSSPVSTRLCD